ncbi:MAG: MBL fold metallo-hydrolase [Gemmatimonadales bacterium]
MNTAERVLRPTDSGVFRTAFLFVGQGDSTLHVIPNGEGGFLYALIDINRDAERGGVDVVRMLEDLLPKVDGKPTLDIFINTHPHNDHICGLDELQKRIGVREIWHTGFEPGDKHAGSYKQLQNLIDRVRKERGDDAIIEYKGTRGIRRVGAVTVNILSPAEHVKEEIDSLKGDDRDARIHEYCGVLRFGYGSDCKYVLMTGDSDKAAWKDHILGSDEYHADRLSATVLDASHHGSRTFFKTSEDDQEPFERAIELISPTWVVVSSPKQSESPHGHPHDDAMALYRKHVARGSVENVRVLGERSECLIYDIYSDGQHVFDTDGGELLDAYPLDGDGDDGKGKKASVTSAAIITRVDSSKPMGNEMGCEP